MVSHGNVVPFDLGARGSLARRGSPDKIVVADRETVVIECPNCSAVLCLDAVLLGLKRKVSCTCCERVIPVIENRL